jgi:hypothetical protein
MTVAPAPSACRAGANRRNRRVMTRARRRIETAAVLVLVAAAVGAAPDLAPAERAAILKAAGFHVPAK